MTRVWRIEPAYDLHGNYLFQECVPENDSLIDFFRVQRKARTSLATVPPVSTLSACPVRFRSSTKQQTLADFLPIYGSEFAASKRAMLEFGDLLSGYVDWFPLRCGKEQYCWMRARTSLDALVREKSVYKTRDYAPTSVFEIEQYFFREATVDGVPIFMIPDGFDFLFCTERFVQIYGAAELTGLAFRLVFPAA